MEFIYSQFDLGEEIILSSVLFLSLGEAVQGNFVLNVGLTDRMTLSYPEPSPVFEEQSKNITSSGNILGIIPNLALPPPPPTVSLGYTLPPEHPCSNFTLPTPQFIKKKLNRLCKFYFVLLIGLFR